MKLKQPFFTIAALSLSALLSLTVFAKDSFNQEKFSELLFKAAAENNGLLALDMQTIQDLLVKAGMERKEADNISPLELAEKFLPGRMGMGVRPGMMGMMRMTEKDFKKLENQFMGLLESHRPAIEEAKKGTVALYNGEDQVVLGTVVDPNGLILTKASDAKAAGRNLRVEIRGERQSARIIETFDEYDLALVKVPAKNLIPVTFHTGEQPGIGAFLAAPGARGDDPIAIGVLSVHARSLDGSDRGFLGVQLAEAEGGIRIREVILGTAALEAGILRGDIIVQLDGKHYESIPEFIAAVGKHRPGDKLAFKIMRGEDEKDYEIVLGTRPKMGQQRPNRFDRMNQMGGSLSKTRDDFHMALQHDMPLAPEECGGPVVDLDGRVLGINIARAGRVKTYAIPSRQIVELLKSVNTVELVKQHRAEEKKVESARLQRAHDDAIAELKKAEEHLQAARKKAEATKKKLGTIAH